MEEKSRCYYCKIQVCLVDDQSPLIPMDLVQDLLPYNSEKIVEIDRILLLSASSSTSKQLVCLNCLENLFPVIEKIIETAKSSKKSLEDQLSLFKKELEQNVPDDSDETLMHALEVKLQEMKSKSQELEEELSKTQLELGNLKKDEHSY